MVPTIRIRPVNAAPVRPEGRYVLYWMVAARRVRHNFALQRAIEQARELGRPLVVFEALRCDHRWACARFHQFVLDGMRDTAAALDGTPAGYYPYVEPAPGAGRGLLDALAGEAALIVTDDFPAFFLPRMIAAAGARLPVRLEAVDGNGLLPLRATETAYPTAYAFRRVLQQRLAAHLAHRPLADPFSGPPLAAAPVLPDALRRRWPDVFRWLDVTPGGLGALPIDHAVGPTALPGGAAAAGRLLDAFVTTGLPRYGQHSHPDEEVTSGLSPYLHWGQVSAHEVFARVAAREGWLGHLPARATGAREGWWGMSPAAEAFLDQLVTWRELGFNMSAHRPEDAERYEGLPAWARTTLERHAGDERDHLYELEAFAAAATHDPVWNAAQRQLVGEGRIHNYLRMLWGKKILEWTATPRLAAEVMIELNNRYALDGRDPNSYSGIFWVLGRYDRPWAPERPVYGVVRYMSSANTTRKLRLKRYLARWAEPAEGAPSKPRQPRLL